MKKLLITFTILLAGCANQVPVVPHAGYCQIKAEKKLSPGCKKATQLPPKTTFQTLVDTLQSHQETLQSCMQQLHQIKQTVSQCNQDTNHYNEMIDKINTENSQYKFWLRF